MEKVKNAAVFLGNLVLGGLSVVFAIAIMIVLVGLWLRLIHFAMGGYSLWT